MSYSFANFSIHKYGQRFCINDDVSQCELSINPKEYIKKIDGKTLYKGNYYVTNKMLIDILTKAKTPKSKELLKLLNNKSDKKEEKVVSKVIDKDETKSNEKTKLPNNNINIKKIINFVDCGKNVINFNGSQCKYFFYNDLIYFKAKDITTILGYANTDQAIRVYIEDSDKFELTSNELHYIKTQVGNEILFS
jgi:hypothetical protein